MSKVNLLSSMNGLADSEVRDALERWCSQVDFSQFYLAVHLDAGQFFSLLEHESIDVSSGMTESDFWQCLPIATHAPIKALLLSPSSMRKRTIQVACDDQQQRWLECAIHDLTDARQSSLILVREVSNQHAEALAFQQEKLRAIAYDRFKFSVLELVLKEQNIACILKKIVNDIEKMHDKMHVAIVLTEDLGQAVQTVIAPSLPVALHNTLSQLHIEAGNGSLATAVAMKQRVIVENVMSHPYWVNHREAARASGVLSGWAEPILNAAGDVQGAFAIYYRQRQTPSDLEQSMMEQTARLVSIVIDRHLSQTSLQNLTSLEPVTGLPNRRRAYEVLAQHSERACGQSYGLIYVDLDHFKWINEAHGHDVGNQLLAQVTERLQKVAQAHFIACMGGDEFLIMISDLAPKRDQALEQLWHLQHKLEKCLTKPFKIGAQKLPLTASMGLCCVSEDDTTDTDYLKAADIAMHKAKQAGRHQACVYEPGMQTEIASQIMLEAELREAIAQQQFRLYYQVQVDHMGRPFGTEVLLRWHHPQRGVIMPMAFISVAETSGLIVDIGTWVLDQACAQLARWQPLPETRELSLSVNISARQFRQANFVAMVKDCLNRHQINPNALRLELTESLLLENVDDAVRIMQELSELGIQFSLDDFGTGFSSLQYLKKLPLYQLKIDRSFVNDIATDSHDRTIVRTIIAMAQSMYLNVIAEGVETQEQMELLLNNGCRRYQGYLFGRPVPIEQFEEWLQAVMV